MSEFLTNSALNQCRDTLKRLQTAIGSRIKGKEHVIDQALISLAAGGHVLIEDLPGVGKTTLAYCLARAMNTEFKRIQFTSDLLPTDVTGISIYDERDREFHFKPGPIFSNIVLADEINRATPKTQSSLLEVMDHGKVTVDGITHEVGSPFMVIATQNPVDYEGTFPLPESQMDRFLMRLQMGYPDPESEIEILAEKSEGYDELKMQDVVDAADIEHIQKTVPNIYLERSILEYLLKLITATRTESEFKSGVSVRGGIALKTAAQARALYLGRDFVLPEDVSQVAKPVMCHRLNLRRPSSDALEERRMVEGILSRLIDSVPQPK
ncbi:AAA family ATPase [Pelagicoccus albus]|uniref:MoxR family ATPase n=1 Tax=Pelagicoccus albus TaxID=415222 RepID=A0A7X1B4T0_9BACT|nr:MoxR family ATPase [Pelagicoccus albus]MBC2605669.1 MoxR family ATPase [Pelagicoccus albus]